MLNDLTWQTRSMLFTQTLGPALALGSLFVLAGDNWTVAAVLFGLGLAVMIGWCVAVVVWNRRVDRRFKAALVRAGEEIVTGRVTATPAIGRVVRSRRARREPAYLAGTPHPLPSPSVALVVTVLTEGGSRRVAALVPAMGGLEARRAPVAVLLHPHEREAAVLDDRVTSEQLAAIASDPRWGTERLPTDSSVAGGYLAAFGCAVLGVLTGVGIAVLAGALAT
ncbi:hypothetical protein [Nocardioides sp. cx-173]|uniref:hypothetical protein n=1 Tax=Nocardioides sp. cx-173 TaxID=2898796 RepID=UPI001E485E44|nr:hypothetical protein [Nocardioides sp. cx-173]MCD4524965.1 hypothetical protein [Nocardioides sp. cx-173]UGB43463.1 hypothetical protein LQ940_08025 [Nocardioides sp. cx-173]